MLLIIKHVYSALDAYSICLEGILLALEGADLHMAVLVIYAHEMLLSLRFDYTVNPTLLSRALFFSHGFADEHTRKTLRAFGDI